MSQRKCDECIMATAHCPALKPKIEEGATRDEVCEMTFEPKVKKDAGFTLIELIVALVIIGVVLSVIAGAVGGCGSLFMTKEFTGTVMDNQVATVPVMGAYKDATMAYSRAVSLKGIEEDIIFSTEDRQFAVVKPGDCVKVKVFQYPPWNFAKAGTYYNGRLVKKWQCTQSER